jgi:WXG100 family type VII secretion target
VVSRYTVDLEQLATFAATLAAFNTRAEQLAAALDAQVEAMRGDWVGVAADTHAQYHRLWSAADTRMRESVLELRRAADHAHRNYHQAVQCNLDMLGS